MTKEQIFELLVRNTREILPELEAHTFEPTDSLKDLGANSLDRTEVLIMTLEDLELETPATAFHGAKSIGDLANLIYENHVSHV